MSKKILVIENDRIFRYALKALLRRREFEIVEAADGYIGMQHILSICSGSEHYDLILLDLLMPRISGMDIIEYMVEEKLQTPVLIMTSMSASDVRFFCAKLENAYLMQKPFTAKDFIFRLNKMLKQPSIPTEEQ